MKKENRKLAQEKRAEERRRMEQNKKLKRYLAFGLPVLAIIILIIVLIVYNANNNTSTEGAKSSTENSTTESSGFSTDESLTVEDGDTVNIDFIGSVDGVEFDGGNTKGAGTDLVIGSNSYIDDFEEQLIGHHPGETVDVNVTFPEDYGKEDLNGKDALFKVTINGIYQ